MFVVVVLTMFGYACIHSWLASTHLKQFVRRLAGEYCYNGFYRAGYNFVAIVTLSPILGLIILRPGHSLWQWTGLAQLIAVLIQAIGLVGVIVSLFQIDLGQFIGLTQIMAFVKQKPLPLAKETLQFKGLYRLVRHPLYLFSLFVIWPMSNMSESLLAFNICTTLYFVIGSLFEERKLVAVYGVQYSEYQKRTPALIPFLKRLREL